MWEIKPDVYAWNFEQCEELLLIAGYEEVKPFFATTETWPADFENHFYDHGNGVAFSFVDHINAARRRKNLEKLDFVETDVLDYGRSPDKMMKSEHRQRVRREWLAATTTERTKRLKRAMEEAALLRPPHIPYAEYRLKTNKIEEENQKSRDEIRRRIAIQIQPAPSAPPSLDVEKAFTMLCYGSHEIWPKVITRLSGDDALAIVPKVEDASLRDALILHALGA